MSLYTFLSDEMPDLLCPVLPYRHWLRARRCIPRAAPEEYIRRFFAVIESARDRAIFLLMLRCGLHISEVTKLKRRDLYLVETPPHMLVSGKNNKERTVYLSDQAAFALRRYLAERPVADCEAVFLNYRGEGLATIGVQKRLEAYRAAAGVGVILLQPVPGTTGGRAR